jgi:hypothetical protein
MIVPHIYKFYSNNVVATSDEQTAADDAVSDTRLCSNYDTADNNNNNNGSSNNVLNESLTSSSTHGSSGTSQAVLVVTALWESLSQCIPHDVMQCVFTTTGIPHDSLLVQAWRKVSNNSHDDISTSGSYLHKLLNIHSALYVCSSNHAIQIYTCYYSKECSQQTIICGFESITTDVKVACECIEEYDVQGNLLKDLYKAATTQTSSSSSTNSDSVPVQELNVSDTLHHTRTRLNALHRCHRFCLLSCIVYADLYVLLYTMLYCTHNTGTVQVL